MEVLHMGQKGRKERKKGTLQVLRVSVFVPEELRRRVRAEAARRGLTVSELVALWIDEQTPKD
jgi:hypothetical protein